jgi:chemotaxis protein CheZ
MPVQRKVFRIEQMTPSACPTAPTGARPGPESSPQELLAELQVLRLLVRHGGPSEHGATRVTRELGAVAAGTERATQQILAAAEAIEGAANVLAAGMNRGQQKALARDISDRVRRIFEACNFQDLSGQRINKISDTFNTLEHHVSRMVDSWSSLLASEGETTVPAPLMRDPDHGSLHGPKLDGDPGHASQEDVDALFAPE